MALNILLVDDSAFMRNMIKKILHQVGVPINTTFEANNGKEGYAILKKESIDLVLSDINMPVLSGLDFIKLVRADQSIKDIPIIVVTTEGTDDVVKEAISVGADDFIRKPFSPEDLAGKIKMLVDFSESEKEEEPTTEDEQPPDF